MDLFNIKTIVDHYGLTYSWNCKTGISGREEVGDFNCKIFGNSTKT